MAAGRETRSLKRESRLLIAKTDDSPLGIEHYNHPRNLGCAHGTAGGMSADSSVSVRGSRMPVEMIVDQWNPRVRRYRDETFCYGPKSCRRSKGVQPRLSHPDAVCDILAATDVDSPMPPKPDRHFPDQQS